MALYRHIYLVHSENAHKRNYNSHRLEIIITKKISLLCQRKVETNHEMPVTLWHINLVTAKSLIGEKWPAHLVTE